MFVSLVEIPMKFTKKQLQEWGLPYDGDPDNGIEVIEDTILENTRWSIIHELIFKVKDKVYECERKASMIYLEDISEHPHKQPN